MAGVATGLKITLRGREAIVFEKLQPKPQLKGLRIGLTLAEGREAQRDHEAHSEEF